MKQAETSRKLIDGTICVVARYGLDKTTTKQIGAQTDLNETYIYRCFGGKEQLLASVFSFLDQELVDLLRESLPVMGISALSMKERCWMLFQRVWHFLLGNKDKCLCYVRYYYSPYFKTYSYEQHKQVYGPVVKEISGAFREKANVWMLLNHILNVMLDFSVKVYDGAVPDNENTTLHIFNLIYASVEQYFKHEEGRWQAV